MTFLVDSHCHLEYFSEEEVEAIISDCNRNNIKYLQNICVETKQFETHILKYALKYHNVFCSFGTHPCHVVNNGFESCDKMFEICNQYNKEIIGIGETGLDYYHDKGQNAKIQKDSFIEHIKLSSITKKPLIIHTRSASDDTLDILFQMKKEFSFDGLIHCFTESLEFAKKCLDMGLYISFSGIVTFKNATDIQNVLQYVPLNRLIVETDSPYLSPEPLRGQKNMPQNVAQVTTFIANLLHLPFEHLCNITTSNFATLFNLQI